MGERSYRTPRSARIIEVIETVANRGAGVEGDPVRDVTQYWTKDGDFLAERDPWRPAHTLQGDTE